jgi:hypothetical protein
MYALLSSIEFWFGAAVLCIYQVAKFSELSSLDPALSARFALIPNLRANDFASRSVFLVMLTAFLAASFVVYLLLCFAAPTVLHGWARVSGAAATEELEKFVGSVPYPLYIAAAFMGLTQSAVPVLSNLGNMQRNLFHAWMGVPRRVVDTSTYLSNQILARSPGAKQLGREVMALIGDAWMARIDLYADTVFYRYQLNRLKLDDEAERKELLAGSQRELRALVGQLVYAASLATVREGGARSLDRLAADLRVTMPPRPASAKDFLAGGILFLFGMMLLWFVVPMFDGFSARFLSAGTTIDFWPDNLAVSGQYLMAQAAPLFLATGLALSAWSNARREAPVQAVGDPLSLKAIEAHLHRYASTFLVVVAGIILYDFCQAFFDYGYFKEGFKDGFWGFVGSNLPFYLLHAFISMVMCFIVLVHVDRIDALAGRQARIAAGTLAAGVGLAAMFYAVSRIHFQFDLAGVAGFDFVVLVVFLNVAAALLAFGTAAFYCRRQLALAASGASTESGQNESNVVALPAAPQALA